MEGALCVPVADELDQNVLAACCGGPQNQGRPCLSPKALLLVRLAALVGRALDQH